MEITIEKNSYWIWKILIKLAYFFLANIRNSLLLFSGIFFVYMAVVIQIYFQNNLNISLMQQIFLFLEKIPLLSNYYDFSQERIYFNGEDLDNFLVYVVLIFTTILEILKYIKNSIFGKPEKKVDYNLKKYIIITVIFLTFLHLMSTIFIFLSMKSSNKDFAGLIIVTFFFWIMHTISTILYLCLDFIMFEFQKLSDDKLLIK